MSGGRSIMGSRQEHAFGRTAVESAYLCIDLKCFYASVECVDRGYDPFEHRLVVADPSRGPTTICLAISPAMKALGVRNRCRVFEIPDGIDYEMAPPRMRRYMEVSAQIYSLYLRFFSPEDIHAYSVDECFIDVAPYLACYGRTPRELAGDLVELVRRETGICATAGVGTNLFLAKVALDVTAKHVPDNIGELDEERFKCLIWPHRPITDIWGIGPGIARRLEALGARTLGEVALLPEEVLYQEFGINAELLIDHAWGLEPCTMAEIHAYRPRARSISNGQVLARDYDFEGARIVLREMADAAAPHAAASRKLDEVTCSRARIIEHLIALYDAVVDKNRPIRRINIGLGALVPEEFATPTLFTDLQAEKSEHDLAEATIAIKRRFGKNALVRGLSHRPQATARERNQQVGGHHE